MEFNQVAFRRLLFFGFVILAVGGMSGIAFAQSKDTQDFANWAQQQQVAPELVKLMQNFGIPDAAHMANSIHESLMIDAMLSTQDFEAGKCETTSKVEFFGPEYGALEGLVRLETVGCFKKGNAASLIDSYFNPEFRIKAIPQLEFADINQGVLCERSGKIPLILDPTKTCVRLIKYQFGNIHTAMTSLISNGEGFSPYYFRESIVTAVDTPQGPKIQILAYTRQKQKVSGAFQGIATQKIVSSQKNILRLLNESLN